MAFNSLYYKNYVSKIVQNRFLYENRLEKKYIIERDSKLGLLSERTETVFCGSNKLNRVLSEKTRRQGAGFYLHSDKITEGHNKYKSVQISFLSSKPGFVSYGNKTSGFLNSISRFPVLTRKNGALSIIFKRTKAGFILYSGGFTGFIHKRQFRNLFFQKKKAFLTSKETRAQFVLSLIGHMRSFRTNFGFIRVKKGKMCLNYNFVNKKSGSKFKRRSFQTKRFRVSFDNTAKKRVKTGSSVLKFKNRSRKTK